MTWSFIALGIGVVLAAMSVAVIVVCVRMVRIAILRANAAEDATRDATARADRAIELWNLEQAARARDCEEMRARLDVLRQTAAATVQHYRDAFDQLARLMCASHEVTPPTPTPPKRVM